LEAWFVLLRFPWEVVGNFMFMRGCWFEKYLPFWVYLGLAFELPAVLLWLTTYPLKL
jgi:hypothetical protein